MKTFNPTFFRVHSIVSAVLFGFALYPLTPAFALEEEINQGLEAGGKLWDFCGNGIDSFFGNLLPWGESEKTEEFRGSLELTPSVEWSQTDGFRFDHKASLDLPMPILSNKFHILLDNVSNFDQPLESDSGRTSREAGLLEDEDWTGGISREKSESTWLSHKINPGIRLENGFGVRVDAAVRQEFSIRASRIAFEQSARFDTVDGWYMRAAVSGKFPLGDDLLMSTHHGAVWHDEGQAWEFGHHIGVKYDFAPAWDVVGDLNGRWGKGGERNDLDLGTKLTLNRSFCEDRLTLFASVGLDMLEQNDFDAEPFVRTGVKIHFTRK